MSKGGKGNVAIVFSGLDGSNPLAFLAALGVLNAASDRAGANQAAPTLAWSYSGAWRPALDGFEGDVGTLVAALMEDLKSWKRDPALTLEYGDGERDLKPPPAEFRGYLRKLVNKAEPESRRSIDCAAAFATDVATDNAGKTKPTALHFTAGQQKFLTAVHGLLEGVTAVDIQEALFGPWRYERDLPVLRWDSSSTRDWALRARDPSKDKPKGVPGADWLAFRGLSFIRVFPDGDRIATTGCFGEWKTGGFRWPLWTVPLSREVVRTLLALPDLDRTSEQERRTRGIGAVFESRIRRSDQGGYGNFNPAASI